MPPPPAKTDAPPGATAPAAPPAKPEKAAPPAPPEPPASAGSAAKGASGVMAWMPAAVCVIVAPAITWATAQYYILPQMQKKLALPPPAELAAAVPTAEATKDGKPKAPSTYEFSSVVVNVAGTMGTRYLKTGLVITGYEKSTIDVKKAFEDNRTKMLDVTINVLSSLTLSDIEEAGSKNVIREKLASAYNQVLGQRVVDQIYFSDFVVQ